MEWDWPTLRLNMFLCKQQEYINEETFIGTQLGRHPIYYSINSFFLCTGRCKEDRKIIPAQFDSIFTSFYFKANFGTQRITSQN